MLQIDWLNDLDQKIFNFVLNSGNNDFTYFKYSLTGDLFDANTDWGLGQAVFATKILYMIDKLKEIDDVRIQNLTALIKSFQKQNGYIYDKLISKFAVFSTAKQFLRQRNLDTLRNIPTKRAETRQSFAALSCLNSKPARPFLYIPYSESGVDKYLSALDWKYPWDAGSHFSHLLFFYKTNKDMFNHQPDLTDHLIDFAIEWVNKLQSKEDGTWHDGEVPLFQKINGAMKIMVGFSVVGFCNLSFAERLIDTALSGINDVHACDNFNIVYPLYFASKYTDYRKDEIERFCLDRLSIYKEFYKEEQGGFSFHKNKANDVYYGAKITKGLDEPDIHGTVMFIWGITLISKILKVEGLNFREPIT